MIWKRFLSSWRQTLLTVVCSLCETLEAWKFYPCLSLFWSRSRWLMPVQEMGDVEANLSSFPQNSYFISLIACPLAKFLHCALSPSSCGFHSIAANRFVLMILSPRLCIHHEISSKLTHFTEMLWCETFCGGMHWDLEEDVL